jgi:nicotinamidase-related amidase
MKKFLILLGSVLFLLPLHAQSEHTALLLIDIQEFYFPGGFSELSEPENAAENAAKILAQFRENGGEIIHVQHKTKTQMAIHSMVEALKDEKRFVKTEINVFNGTQIKDYLDSLDTDTLVIAGMQTHMCVEAATRAAYDYGYKVLLIHDACATRELSWENVTIGAEEVHYSTLNTLRNYAEVISTEAYLKRITRHQE